MIIAPIGARCSVLYTLMCCYNLVCLLFLTSCLESIRSKIVLSGYICFSWSTGLSIKTSLGRTAEQ